MVNAKQWLERVRKLDALIDSKIAEREQLWAMVTRITATISDMPRGGGVSDTVGNGAVRIRQQAEECGRIIEEYRQHRQKVIETLEVLPEKEYSVLHRRYIRYMTVEETAANLGISTVTVWAREQSGLEMLDKILEFN